MRTYFDLVESADTTARAARRAYGSIAGPPRWIPMLEEDKRLTAFVFDAGLFEFNQTPVGLKGSGNTFVRAMNVILSSLRKFTGSFIDDVAVDSHQWQEHLNHVDRFLAVVKRYSLTLSLKKVSICSESSQILWRNHWIGENIHGP